MNNPIDTRHSLVKRIDALGDLVEIGDLVGFYQMAKPWSCLNEFLSLQEGSGGEPDLDSQLEEIVNNVRSDETSSTGYKDFLIVRYSHVAEFCDLEAYIGFPHHLWQCAGYTLKCPHITHQAAMQYRSPSPTATLVQDRCISPTIRFSSLSMSEQPRFVCSVSSCRKSFLRQDHLTRHKLNHQSRQHRCEFPGCNQSFVRRDVYMKHFRRKHKDVNKPMETTKFKPVVAETTSRQTRSAPKVSSPSTQSEINPSSPTETPTASTAIVSNKLPVNSTQLNHNPFSIDELVSSDELITWLFGGIDSHLQVSPINLISPPKSSENFPDLEEFEYPVPKQLGSPGPDEPEEKLAHFPFSDQQVLVDEEVMESLEDALPPIKFQQDFKQHKLQVYLENYWKYFHPQFPILNMPSFSTKKAHPVLLLSMLTIGAYITGTLTPASGQSMIFFESMAVPLRWTIYKSKEFKPPPKLWIVQSLVILQTYEICCSSRDLHERANLHRGLSIQMLKRSPMFGGNPWMKYSSNSQTISPYAATSEWEKWIQEESMKRCALVTFYLETLHAVVFGHDMIIDLHDVKPTLPCDEPFWRSAKYSEGCLEVPLTLLASIKSILHKKAVRTRGFGQRIILSGLIALSFEVNDRQFEFSLSELKSMKQLWQRKIREAFQFWDLNCSLLNVHSEWYNTYSIPFRELYESYTQLKHYDFMVYAGAPGRMNVEFSEEEVEVVWARVKEWAGSSHGRRSIVLIYYYLYNLLFHNDNPIHYIPKNDRCVYRKQMISHMLIILWCYNFYTCGPEITNQEDYSAGYQGFHKESGHDYLKRVKQELELLAGRLFTNVYRDIDIFANFVDSVSDRGNMAGLLRLFKSEYSGDSSEIAREHSRLMENCINRSHGSKNVFCNMFE